MMKRFLIIFYLVFIQLYINACEPRSLCYEWPISKGIIYPAINNIKFDLHLLNNFGNSYQENDTILINRQINLNYELLFKNLISKTNVIKNKMDSDSLNLLTENSYPFSIEAYLNEDNSKFKGIKFYDLGIFWENSQFQYNFLCLCLNNGNENFKYLSLIKVDKKNNEIISFIELNYFNKFNNKKYAFLPYLLINTSEIKYLGDRLILLKNNDFNPNEKRYNTNDYCINTHIQYNLISIDNNGDLTISPSKEFK